MAQRDASDSWGRMEEPGAVAIGGKRGGVAVAVEVGETLPNKAKRTQMRAAGRPEKRRLRGEAVGRNGARFELPRIGESGRCD